MKYLGIEWWVEYNFKDGIAINIMTFTDKQEADVFAKVHNSEAVETKKYQC